MKPDDEEERGGGTNTLLALLFAIALVGGVFALSAFLPHLR